MRQGLQTCRVANCLLLHPSRVSAVQKFLLCTQSRLRIVDATPKHHAHYQRSTKGGRRSFTSTSGGEPTIYALSTAPGRAAIAIIRVSGPACLTVHRALCPRKPAPKPRYATLRTLYEPVECKTEAQVLDQNALVLHFPAPETATGEDVLEFHVHGGTAVVKAVLAAIPKSIPEGSSHAIRYAEPGEFTRRAFYNDRLNLLQIEALGDTLSADTEQQRLLAVRGSSNVLAHRYESWRQKLLQARGELEALIDFSEDQHFDESPTQLCASVAQQAQQLKSQLQANVESGSRGELLRNGISIALVGEPNAGKSSLLNQIVGREAAIVSDEPGTTRDVVDVNVDIGGFYCRFGDVAGLRKQSAFLNCQTIGAIEQEGIRRAKERALSADVVIAVLPATIIDQREGPEASVEIDAEVLRILEQCDTNKQKIVCIINKVDLFADNAQLSEQRSKLREHPVLSKYMDLSKTTLYGVSCEAASQITSENPDPGGIQSLLAGLTQLFRRMTTAIVPEGEPAISSNPAWAESLGASERQRVLLSRCVECLQRFLVEVKPSRNIAAELDDQEREVDIVLAAEHLRSAADCLSKITGKGEAGDVEEVLGVVFEKYAAFQTLGFHRADSRHRFCVGK